MSAILSEKETNE